MDSAQDSIVNKQNSPPIKTSGYKVKYQVTQEKLNMTVLLAVCAILFLYMKFRNRFVRRSSPPCSTSVKAPGTRGQRKDDTMSETEEKKSATEAPVPYTEGIRIEKAPGRDHKYDELVVVTRFILKTKTGETRAIHLQDTPPKVEEETIYDEVSDVMSLPERERE